LGGWRLAVVFAALVSFGLLWFVLRPRSTSDAEVADLRRVSLGGVEQLVLSRGSDRSKPVLLFLHGGPGASVMPAASWMHAGLEEHAIVVHWDQRGSATACDLPPESLTLERLVADAEELAAHLRSRHGVERIGVIGASWGSIIGLTLALRRPDWIWAYVGEGQIVNTVRGEAEALRFARAQAAEREDARTLGELEGLSVPLDAPQEVAKLRRALGRYGGIWGDGGPYLVTMARMLAGPEHRAAEKLRYLPCVASSTQVLYQDIRAVAFDEQVTATATPSFIFQGTRDHLAPPRLVASWAEGLGGRGAQIVWFEGAGHVPSIERPEEYLAAMKRWVLPLAERAGER